MIYQHTTGNYTDSINDSLNAQSSAIMKITMSVPEPFENARVAQWAAHAVQCRYRTEKRHFNGACKVSLLAVRVSYADREGA